MKTKDKLVACLKEARETITDSRIEVMISRAQAGYYDDYESPIAAPLHQLAHDCLQLGLRDIAQKVIDGKFDGTKEEAAEWFDREGKHLFDSGCQGWPEHEGETSGPART